MTMKKKYSIQTKYGTFEAKIWYEKSDTVYLVETVGFDRTMTQGRSLAEAKHMAKDLFELLVECELDQGRAVADTTRRIYGKKLKPNHVYQLTPA
jgi:predicted RNase H-like HicB family nuclease